MPGCTVTIDIQGLTCTDCCASVEKRLSSLPGVLHVRIGLFTHRGVVVLDSDAPLSPQDLVTEVDQLGFSSTIVSVRTGDSGGSGSNELMLELGPIERRLASMIECEIRRRFEETEGCSIKVTESLAARDGPRTRLCIDLTLGPQVGVRAAFDRVVAVATDRVPDATVRVVDGSHGSRTRGQMTDEQIWRRKLLMSLVIVIPILLIELLPAYFASARAIALSPVPYIPRVTLRDLATCVLAAPLQFYIAFPIYRSAWAALRYNHTANMDTLITLSTMTAYLYSLVLLVMRVFHLVAADQEEELFFGTAAYLLCLIILGRWLEVMAKGRTSMALESLHSMQPRTAILIEPTATARSSSCSTSLSPESFESWQRQHPSTRDCEIDVLLVQRSDYLRVNDGEKIPVDGVIVSGHTSVDESLLTGESMPVSKSAAERSVLTGGTVSEPCVSVPVLSNTTVVTRAAASIAAPVLNRIPSLPATPEPTMVAVGDARASAHGHEITKTVMANMMASVHGVCSVAIQPLLAR